MNVMTKLNNDDSYTAFAVVPRSNRARTLGEMDASG